MKIWETSCDGTDYGGLPEDAEWTGDTSDENTPPSVVSSSPAQPKKKNKTKKLALYKIRRKKGGVGFWPTPFGQPGQPHCLSSKAIFVSHLGPGLASAGHFFFFICRILVSTASLGLTLGSHKLFLKIQTNQIACLPTLATRVIQGSNYEDIEILAAHNPRDFKFVFECLSPKLWSLLCYEHEIVFFLRENRQIRETSAETAFRASFCLKTKFYTK